MTIERAADALVPEIREGVRALCAQFPPAGRCAVDAARAYPEAFVDALTRAGWLAALIPQDDGGSGLGLAEASAILEEINRSGGNGGACHGPTDNMGTLLRHGSAAQKQRWLPDMVPDGHLIGTEGQGFRQVLDGLDAERTLIAAECIGDGRWFVDKVTAYAKERVVFGRPIGQNQGVQFPIAEAHIDLGAADGMRWEAAIAALQFHGGFGFACDYDVERTFRGTRLYPAAPISTNLILSHVAERALGLPRSF
jgi:alkylation response protein AidB-like acyl-CoA dehydrogenase